MKILIISSPRSGSTALFNGLYKTLNNFKGFCEPFNAGNESLGDSYKEYSLNYPNLLVKILPWDLLNIKPLPPYFTNLLFSKNFISLDILLTYILEDLIKYSSNFDKIILLKRKNEIESSKSSVYASINEKNYHSSYLYDNTKYDYSKDLNFIVNHNNIIHHLSNSLNLPIILYENLYSGNKKYLNNFLETNNLKVNNFDLFCEYLNPKNRYRQN